MRTSVGENDAVEDMMTLLLCGSVVAGARAQHVDGWADVIHTEVARGNPLPRLTELVPDLDLDEAYAVQRALVAIERPRRGIGGYKAGFTNPATRAPFGLAGPVSGVLYRDGALTSGATLDLRRFRRLMIEVEIGYVLRSAITRSMKSVDDLLTYVRDIVPVVELPDAAYDDPARLNGRDLVATNLASRAYIVGAPLRLARPAAVNELAFVLYRDGASIDHGAARNALGDQLAALLWLVNHVQAAGQPLAAGQVLITGTLGKMSPGEPGVYRLEFGPAGGLDFRLVGAPQQAGDAVMGVQAR